MKTVTLLLAAMIATPTVAFAQGVRPDVPGRAVGAPPPPPRIPLQPPKNQAGNQAPVTTGVASIGDFLYMGVRYRNARAMLSPTNRNKIVVQGTLDGNTIGQVEVPWEKAPSTLQKRLALMREARPEPVRQPEGQPPPGTEHVQGKVSAKTRTGILVKDSASGGLFHVTGKTDLAEGDEFEGNLKRDGVYRHRNEEGELITLKSYLP